MAGTQTFIKPPLLKFANVLHYEAGWFACVLGASYGIPWIGPAVAALFIAFDLAVITQPARELAFVTAAGLLGFGVDTGLAALGAFSFVAQEQYPWLAPPWMVALWMLFATLFHSALSWLQGRYLLGAVLGATGGPLAYFGGAALGPIKMSQHLAASLTTIAAGWALATVALLWLFARIGPRQA